MRYLFLMFFLTANLFAITPFSLEGLKSANVKVLYKGKILSKEFKQELNSKVKKELKEKLSIKTSSENFTNLLVKIELLKFKTQYAANVTLFIAEDAILKNREEPHEAIALTYRKNDLFDTDKKNLHNDIKESIFEYLLDDFIEQYKAEN